LRGIGSVLEKNGDTDLLRKVKVQWELGCTGRDACGFGLGREGKKVRRSRDQKGIDIGGSTFELTLR